MKIAFHSNQISIRGTEVALYDYAHYNETILGNKSIIMTKDPEIWPYSHPLAIQKFNNRFDVYYYKDIKEIDTILEQNNIDLFYAQKSGRCDDVVSNKVKTCIHAVFQDYEPHGDVYAYISKWLGDKFKMPFVPYICQIPLIKDGLRKELNIPIDAIVFGRHGGMETFDVNFAKQAVREIKNSNKYFLFMNTEKFTDQKNCIFLDSTSIPEEKSKFINTCDVMLHARMRGESFGLAIAEFSLLNKPIITWTGGIDRAHIEMLGEKAFYYNNKAELLHILHNFKKAEGDYNMYSKFSPENVMEQFKKIFI